MTVLMDLFRARSAGPGRVGAVVLDVDAREALAIDPDGVYLAASTIKIPLVMTLYADAQEGRLDLGECLPVRPHVDGSGVLRDLVDVETLSLRDLAALAMMVSDNTATNRLIERLGTARVNERLAEWGCRSTRLGRGMFDLEAKARGLENLMTARETASLLLRVREGAAGGDGAMSSVLGLLERNTNLLRLGRYLPEGVPLAHKDGWMDGVDNDAGLVGPPQRRVVAVGLTSGLAPARARPLLGLLGLLAAELAGARVDPLPPEVAAGA